MTKALGPEVLLAYAMNGEPLEAEHGAPLRVVVPGYAGVRSPKWLHTITVQDSPSDNPMQADDYKLFPPHVTKATSDLPPGEHELAVRAWDAAGQTQPALPDDTWNFKGYLSAAWHRISVVVA